MSIKNPCLILLIRVSFFFICSNWQKNKQKQADEKPESTVSKPLASIRNLHFSTFKFLSDMKNLYCFLFVIGSFFAASTAFGQNYLTIINPQAQWQQRQGTIEEAAFSVRPKGIYMECGLYLTFSARNWNTYFNQDSLEAVLNFALPEGSIIHDSWLWINDDIARGKILDRWTASQIYEGIVKRRSDPSILTKNSATQYSLRVYPLLKNETRRVKITYLMPVDWSKRQVSLAVPGHILQASYVQNQNFNVLVFPGDDWKDLSFTNLANVNWEQLNDPAAGGKYFRTVLAQSQHSQNPSLSFTPPMKNGLYVSTFGDTTDGVYQLALLPSALLDEQKPVKLAVVFDQEFQSNDLTMPQLLARTRDQLKLTLNPNDSFNLFFANLVVQPHKPNWLPADDATIDLIFNALSNPSSGYSQMPVLLGSAIQFIKSRGGNGQIMLLSNTAQFANLTSSNNLLTDLKAAIAPDQIPVHIIDFRSSSSPSFWANSFYYYANSYLYTNLSKQTGGSYASIRDNQYDVSKTFSSGFNAIGSQIQNLEMTTGLASGYCFGRFTPGGSVQLSAPVNRPILQIGKFKGQPPFKISISGEVNGEFFYKTRTVAAADIRPADSLNREMWYGNFIQLLEKEPATNSGISQIIFNSISERVLSRYTAFLCLEDTTTYCHNCLDEAQFTDTDEIAADSLVKISPNPFSDFVKIEVQGIEPSLAAATTMEVFNLAGQLIQVLEVEPNGDSATAIWRGSDSRGEQVSAGVYLVLIKNRQMSRAVKLIKT